MKPRYRKVSNALWNDSKFRTLGDDAKLVFLLLLTHPLQTSLGAMRAAAAAAWLTEHPEPASGDAPWQGDLF